MDFVQDVWFAARHKHNFLQEFILKFGNADTILHLSYCQIDCPRLPANSLWSHMDKICQITMCRICVDADGTPTIFYDGANTKNTVIRPNNIISIDAESSRENNKVPLPTITVKDRTKHINEEVASVTYSIYDYTTTPRLDTLAGQQIIRNDVAWTFVGGDKVRNPNVGVVEVASVEPRGAIISFDTDVAANTHAATSYSTSISWRELNNVAVMGEQSVGDNEQEKVDFDFDKQKGTVHLKFFLTRTFEEEDSGIAVLTARTSVKGNFYTDAPDKVYKSTPKDVTYASSPREIISNELLQENNAYKDPYVPSTTDEGVLYTPLYLQILEEVSRKYGNGLECCEIECTFGDYYTESGEKVIDGSGINAPIQGFSRYDIVTPYIQKGYKTIPYKLDDNGNPMSFKVIGIKYNYNGVLRQTLCLQEYVS